MSLEAGDLMIRDVRLDGSPLEYSRVGSWLDVAAPASTEPLTLSIAYDFSVRNFSADGARPDGSTFTWPYYCGNLFPCRSDPAQGSPAGMQDVLDAVAEVSGYDPTTCAEQWLVEREPPSSFISPCP